MSYEFINDRKPVARKQHICSECGEPILKGTKHHYQTGMSDGEFYQWRCHQDCYDLVVKMHADADLCWYEGLQPLSEYDFSEVLSYRGEFPHAVCRYERHMDRSNEQWEARQAARRKTREQASNNLEALGRINAFSAPQTPGAAQ